MTPFSRSVYNKRMEYKTVALVLNAPEIKTEIAESAIVAADGGFRHVKGKKVLALIGDFDTLCDIPEGVDIVRFPVEKNSTDGELALDYIKSLGAEKAVIYGGFGGKPEHVIGNLNLLAYADSLNMRAEILDGDTRAYFTRNTLEIDCKTGDSVSVFPFGGCAVVARSESLYYPLENLLLEPQKSRGISNRATSDKVLLEVSSGAITVIVRRG